jgi:small subunit ribosomal protein S19
MAKVFTFKGLTEEELQKLSIEEFSKLVDSRARRALKRLLEGKNFDYAKLIRKVEKIKKEGKEKDKIIKTHVREAVILPQWIGLKFGVYNGKKFEVITITRDMIGRRLGEFSHTTKRVIHSAPGIRATRSTKFIAAK